jgi:hypothetical protein
MAVGCPGSISEAMKVKGAPAYLLISTNIAKSLSVSQSGSKSLLQRSESRFKQFIIKLHPPTCPFQPF